jgi:putative sterol carrier protein
MLTFPSKEWVEFFVEKLNSSPEFAVAGEGWEGDIVFVVESDENFPRTSCVYLDLFRGKCRRFEYVENCIQEGEKGVVTTMPRSEFKYKGPYKNWVKLINKEIEPIQGVITGKFTLEGPLMRMIANRKAAKEIVNVAASIESDVKKRNKP